MYSIHYLSLNSAENGGTLRKNGFLFQLQKSTKKRTMTTKALQLQKQYHDEAFRLITKGLDLDETDAEQSALYYKQGAEVLQKALSIQFNERERLVILIIFSSSQ